MQILKNVLNKGLYQTGDYPVLWQVHPSHELGTNTVSLVDGRHAVRQYIEDNK